ncbi:MAG: EAL domain-containing protein [Piscinibacter sp.]|uniref:EAL domain-containing response regulator n=1 Tax=Piscinibacter TaxID=1114981 RepID=UPI000FDEC828|nr:MULTISPECIES: EAL domain-containing protein [Piscinibacter]MCW5665235.1 EAL domain-containing protein [Piscinibacter sp.]
MNAEPAAETLPSRWKVLLVDDEPDVHEVSRLILAGLGFEGRPVELLSAGSAAQARELLAQHGDVALALVDVVMETDDAGIALVRHIREQLDDHDMQIVLRTGQPGMAPEREIVPHYEVNGYFLKTEITAQRLQSIVIAGLRGFRHARSLRRLPVRLPARPAAGDAALAAELGGSAARDALVLLVQPELELASGRLRGAELVPQWKSSRGLLPAARVAGLLGPGPARRALAQGLLQQALAWARQWQERLAAPLRVSLPLVGDDLDDPAWRAAVNRLVDAAALPAGSIDLLVGEATLLAGTPGLPAAADEWRAHGLMLTLLDFGAQTISLQRLSQLVPDRVKLHRPFVRGVASDPSRAAVARSLMALAQTLNVAVVADGIASDADAQFFRWEGCEFGQGDALAPACAPGDLVTLVRAGPPGSH